MCIYIYIYVYVYTIVLVTYLYLLCLNSLTMLINTTVNTHTRDHGQAPRMDEGPRDHF